PLPRQRHADSPPLMDAMPAVASARTSGTGRSAGGREVESSRMNSRARFVALSGAVDWLTSLGSASRAAAGHAGGHTWAAYTEVFWDGAPRNKHDVGLLTYGCQTNWSRRTPFRILPVAFFGNSCTNANSRG